MPRRSGDMVNVLVSLFIPIYSGKKENLQVAVTPVISG
jgi:hypothetical protein